jgi:hypothetical protein
MVCTPRLTLRKSQSNRFEGVVVVVVVVVVVGLSVNEREGRTCLQAKIEGEMGKT